MEGFIVKSLHYLERFFVAFIPWECFFIAIGSGPFFRDHPWARDWFLEKVGLSQRLFTLSI